MSRLRSASARLAGALKRGGPYTVVDPNLLDAGGTTAITVFEPDATGDRVVYGLSRDGSDRQELLIHDVAAGAALEDRLRLGEVRVDRVVGRSDSSTRATRRGNSTAVRCGFTGSAIRRPPIG